MVTIIPVNHICAVIVAWLNASREVELVLE